MKEQRIREELTECRELLADLFQGGISNIAESLMARLRQEANHIGQFGMEWLSGRLVELAEKLESRRHEISNEKDSEICDLMCNIMVYLEEGIRQSGLDEAGTLICQKEWEQE